MPEKTLRLLVPALVLAILGVSTASAELLITSTGSATVEVSPTLVRYRIEKTFEGATLLDTADQAVAFEDDLSRGLSDLDLRPARRSAPRIVLHHAEAPRAEVSIRMSFSVDDSAELRVRVREVAVIVERLRKLAVSMRCSLESEAAEVEEPLLLEEEAVARATENALYHADATGALLNAHVAEVREVTIVSVEWEGLDLDPYAAPVAAQARCTAKVRVTYLYETQRRNR